MVADGGVEGDFLDAVLVQVEVPAQVLVPAAVAAGADAAAVDDVAGVDRKGEVPLGHLRSHIPGRCAGGRAGGARTAVTQARKGDLRGVRGRRSAEGDVGPRGQVHAAGVDTIMVGGVRGQARDGGRMPVFAISGEGGGGCGLGIAGVGAVMHFAGPGRIGGPGDDD